MTKAKKRKVDSVAFTVTGEFVTDYFRQVCLEGDWRNAIEGLTASINGLSNELAYKVLDGTKRFEGDSNTGIDYVDEEKSVKEEIQKRFYDLYGSIWFNKEDNKKYKIKYVANDFEDILLWYNTNFEESFKSISDIPLNELINIFEITDGLCNIVSFKDKEYFVVWKESGVELPPWINYTKEALEAFEKTNSFSTIEPTNKMYLRELEDTKEYLADIEEEKQQEIKQMEAVEKLGKEIWKENGEEFVELEGYKIPKKPLAYWAVMRTPLRHLIPRWKPVSPIGFKMINDNPVHTDWVVGAGLNPTTFYKKHDDVNMAAYMWASELQRTINKGDFTAIVVSRKSELVDKVTHPHPQDKIESNIVYIPDCSLKWDKIGRQIGEAGGIILTKKGGQLSHLALKSEDYGLTILVHEKADEVFTNGLEGVSIQPDKLTYHLKRNF